MRVAIDSGGTFTDCVYMVDGSLAMRKVLSTPGDPAAAILKVIGEVSGELALVSVRHGTTVGTNAMLERKGARVAFVTTAGFEDSIAIGRQARRSLYDWFDSPPPSIVPAELRFGVEERTTAEGQVLRSPSEAELERLCREIAASGAESIALSLLFCFANPANEELVAAALGQLRLPVSVSSRILPEFREYERGATVVVNAYLAPMVGSYLRGLSAALGLTYPGVRLHVMQSSGGIVSAALAAEEPVRTVLSGPAGGVIGAYRVGLLAGCEKLITFDMGGTSTDVSLIDATAGGTNTTKEAVIAGMPIAVPMLDIHTVGAGGGSIARYDAGGILHVGPESAGAMPGPVCYGRGEMLTVTDANLLLGRLDANDFLGGAMVLDEQRAREFASKYVVGAELVEELAAGVLLVAEAAMEKAIRVISIERGYDPREFTLLAFGGGGPLHACALARSLSMPRVLVPRMPGALSALGILLADAVRDYSKTVMVSYTAGGTEECFMELEARALREMETGKEPEVERSIDLRYVGQGYEVNVRAGVDALERFHQEHRLRYGYADESRQVEVVTVRVRAVVRECAVELATEAHVPGDGSHAVVKRRPNYFDGVACETPVYARSKLRCGDTFQGPALITEYSATTVVGLQDLVRVDKYGNLIIEVRCG